MNVHRLLLISILVLTLTGAAQAAEIFSPALPAIGTQSLWCQIVNVGKHTHTVKIQAFDAKGRQQADTAQVLAAGQVGGTLIPASAIALYCKFTVDGPKGAFRASIAVLQAGGNSIVVALPAFAEDAD
jgi:hypothetical protein